jgi:FkbM family methyltransferase
MILNLKRKLKRDFIHIWNKYLSKIIGISTSYNINKEIPNDIQTIIDVGVGYGTSYFKNFEGDLFLFEPNDKFHSILTKKFPNAILFKVALSNSKGISYLFLDSLSSSLLRGSGKKVKVDVDTLNNYLSYFESKQNVLLKIDTEGNDLNTLKGGEGVLKYFKYIIIEIGQDDAFYNTSEIVDYLYSKGFRWMKILDFATRNHGGIDYIDVMFKNINYD